LPVNSDRDDDAITVAMFSTPRLHAERMTRDHADYLAEMNRDPEVMATLGGVRTPEASAEFLRRNLEHWDHNGFGQWMFRDATDQLVGRGGLRWIDPSVGEQIVEVGYAFQRSAWGMGYATEATIAVIEVARNRYGMQQLGAIALDTNTASIRVLTKCGFTFEREVMHPAGPHRFFRLTL
jgi:[ribosomal protein S5]-alanine N-acetyltransferase